MNALTPQKIEQKLLASPQGRSAVISPCGVYRYWLERGPESSPYVAWVLANPSTADAEKDDPTVRKARGFTSRWGFDRFVFVNLCAGRATKPNDLAKMTQPIGPENNQYIMRAIRNAEFVVLAWGNAVHKSLRHRQAYVVNLVRANRDDAFIKCLGRTGDGQPRHPLMLAYETPLEQYAQPHAPARTNP